MPGGTVNARFTLPMGSWGWNPGTTGEMPSTTITKPVSETWIDGSGPAGRLPVMKASARIRYGLPANAPPGLEKSTLRMLFGETCLMSLAAPLLTGPLTPVARTRSSLVPGKSTTGEAGVTMMLPEDY